MRDTLESILLVLVAPFLIMAHYLSFLWIYRRIRGGHWEHQRLGAPCDGLIWVRMKRKDCYRMTGKRPGGLVVGDPYCEEKGEPAYGGACYCECGRDLTRAPGVVGSYEGDQNTSEVFGYSCPCGRWPRFLFGPPAAIYLGDSRDGDQRSTVSS